MSDSEPDADEALEIISQRSFKYPRTRLFEAFANPDLLKTWWGPKGFSSSFKQFDFRPGGEWLFTLHGPDGTNYDNHHSFIDIAIPDHIVMQHHGPVHGFRITMSYESVADDTLVTWRMVFDPSPANAGLKAFIEGANQENFDRLEVCLQDMARQRF